MLSTIGLLSTVRSIGEGWSKVCCFFDIALRRTIKAYIMGKIIALANQKAE
jgi:hypothetical protein